MGLLLSLPFLLQRWCLKPWQSSCDHQYWAGQNAKELKMVKWKWRRNLEFSQHHWTVSGSCWSSYVRNIRSIDFSPTYSNILYLQPNTIPTSPSGQFQAKGPLCSESCLGLWEAVCRMESMCIRAWGERGCQGRLGTEHKGLSLPYRGGQKRALHNFKGGRKMIVFVF